MSSSSSNKQEKNSSKLTSAPLGQPLPLDDHACSVSLPTWSSVVGYEEGDAQISEALSCGYPRFVYHPYVLKLMNVALEIDAKKRQGDDGENGDWDCLLLPSGRSAARCHDFLIRASSTSSSSSNSKKLISSDNALDPADEAIQSFIDSTSSKNSSPFRILDLQAANVHALLFPARTDVAIEAKTYWQHTGEVVSSRRAEVALKTLTKNSDTIDLGGLQHVTSDYYNEEKMQELEDNMDGDGWGDFEEKGWDLCPDTMQHYLCLHPASEHDDNEDNFNEYEQIYNIHKGKEMMQNKSVDPYEEIKQRIANIISSTSNSNEETRKISGVEPSDVFLSPTGMSAIYTALRSARRRRLEKNSTSSTAAKLSKSAGSGGGTAIVYGFPYLDTLKLCSRPEFVPDGVEFFGHGDAQDLSSLQALLSKKREKNNGDAGICALITEFPSNPLLRCPDIYELRLLADEYNFCLIVDDTIGNFANLNLLSSGLADAVCTSLTKLFNGRGDAMAGSLIVNTQTDIGRWMKQDLSVHHVENEGLWKGDVMAINANSVDFLQRSSKINETAERLADWFYHHEDVAMLYYPKYTMDENGGDSGEGSSSNKNLYDRVLQDPVPVSTENSHGTFEQHKPGYGGLISVILHSHVCQRTFFDHLDFPKGPSLGTNFTLACPYTLLAHYHELDFATSYGVMPNLLRISVGLEDFDVLKAKMEDAFRNSKLHPKVPPICRASPVLSSGSFSTLAGDNKKRFYSSASSPSRAEFMRKRFIAQHDKVSTGSGVLSTQSSTIWSRNIYKRSSWFESSSTTSDSVRSISTAGVAAAGGSSGGNSNEIQTCHCYIDLSYRIVTFLGFVGTRGRRFVSTSSTLSRPLPAGVRLG